jgi:hypothetical protein
MFDRAEQDEDEESRSHYLTAKSHYTNKKALRANSQSLEKANLRTGRPDQ